MSAAADIPEKARLRAEALARRDQLGLAQRASLSERIAERGAELLKRLSPKVIAAYWPIRSECNPVPLVGLARGQGATIALPVVQADGLLFRRWRDGGPLLPSAFATMVPPAEAPTVDPEVILVPLAAFDRRGMRIGYGLGYYDRAVAALTAAGHKPRLIGLAFALQEIASVPAEPHDVRLDFVVTEAEVLAPSS